MSVSAGRSCPERTQFVADPFQAITAMAHKPARILWHLLKHGVPYDPKVWATTKEPSKKLPRLHQNAAALGYKLISNTTA
jgi:hypothetical protein